MTNLPEVVTDEAFDGPRFFALVNADNPDSVFYYGIDVGNGAFTVRRDPDTQHTNFGSWISMRTAFRRLNSMAGEQSRMALVVFDSVPAEALTAWGDVVEAIPDGRREQSAIEQAP